MGYYFAKCRAAALNHADGLIKRIKAGTLNASAFENLMRGYLGQPAFYEHDKPTLMALALERYNGR